MAPLVTSRIWIWAVSVAGMVVIPEGVVNVNVVPPPDGMPSMQV